MHKRACIWKPFGSERVNNVNWWNIPILQKYCTYFKRAYCFVRIYIFTINSIFRHPKEYFSKYHFIYFAGSDLGSIILKWNDISEVTVTDPIERNHCIASILEYFILNHTGLVLLHSVNIFCILHMFCSVSFFYILCIVLV